MQIFFSKITYQVLKLCLKSIQPHSLIASDHACPKYQFLKIIQIETAATNIAGCLGLVSNHHDHLISDCSEILLVFADAGLAPIISDDVTTVSVEKTLLSFFVPQRIS